MKAGTELVAVNSKLGWLLSGPADACVTDIITHSNFVISNAQPEVHLKMTSCIQCQVDSGRQIRMAQAQTLSLNLTTETFYQDCSLWMTIIK